MLGVLASSQNPKADYGTLWHQPGEQTERQQGERVMDVKVRVYFKSEIMDHPKFLAKHHSDKHGPDVAHFFNDLRIYFSEGCFYMDTIGGQVPEVLKPFVSGKYSIHDYYLPGFRHGGLYRDARFDQTEAQVKQCNTSRPQGSDSYNIEIVGTNLEYVLGLYHAILSDELLPVSVGKSPVQLIEELRANLFNRESVISDLNRVISELNDRAKVALETIRSMRSMKPALALAHEMNVDLQGNIDALKSHVKVLRQWLDEANKPWYRKFWTWLIKGDPYAFEKAPR